MVIRQCGFSRDEYSFQSHTNMLFKENEESQGNKSFWASLEGSVRSPNLGLTLRKSASFINLLESKLAEARQQQKIMDDFIAQSKAEKRKASNFPATLLIIGSWQRSTKNEGDLIAKLYFSKRKLVWEMLEVALKTKIEIQWSDISAIRARFPDNDYAQLEIELNQPPSFFRETNPQPRKHTIWEQSPDFTGGEAPICRRHTVYFPPGTLEKHYEKLLQCDQRLFDLSRKSFLIDEYPYFHPNPYRYSDFPSGCLPEFSHVQPNHPIQNLPILPAHLNNFKHNMNPNFANMNPISPMSVMDLPVLDEGGSSYVNENQWCDPGVNNQIQVLDSTTVATIQGNANQNYYLNYGEDLSARMNNPNNVFDDFENQLLGNFPATYSDEMAFLTTLDLQQTVENTIPDPLQQPNCWLPHQQVSNNNIYVNSLVNTSVYPYVGPTEPTMEDFAAIASRQNTHHWK